MLNVRFDLENEEVKDKELNGFYWVRVEQLQTFGCYNWAAEQAKQSYKQSRATSAMPWNSSTNQSKSMLCIETGQSSKRLFSFSAEPSFLWEPSELPALPLPTWFCDISLNHRPFPLELFFLTESVLTESVKQIKDGTVIYNYHLHLSEWFPSISFSNKLITISKNSCRVSVSLSFVEMVAHFHFMMFEYFQLQLFEWLPSTIFTAAPGHCPRPFLPQTFY